MKKGAQHKSTDDSSHVQHHKPDHAEHHQATVQQPKKISFSKNVIITITIVALVVIGVVWLLSAKEKIPATGDTMIIAKVNNDPIYAKDLEQIYAQAQQQGLPVTKEQLLDQLVAKQVLLQEAKKQKFEVTDVDVDQYKKNLESLIGQPIGPLLEKMGMTEEQFNKQTKEQLMITKFIAKAQQDMKIEVTDIDVKKFYDENPDYFALPEQVNASHILVKTEEEAKDIFKMVKEGKDFGALAQEKSIDPSAKQNNGNLGFFGKGQMVPEFEAVAFSLKEGAVSDSVKTQFGYHIIKLHKKEAAKTLSFEEAKADIKKGLEEEKAKESLDVYVKGLVAKAKVEKLNTKQ